MSSPATPLLLNVIELLGYPNRRPLFERLGYRVQTEFAVRKAIGRMRQERPAVIVADCYFQPDFRDRVSNLESLLATAQSLGNIPVLVLYEAPHRHALERLRQRFALAGACAQPVSDADLAASLAAAGAPPAAG